MEGKAIFAAKHLLVAGRGWTVCRTLVFTRTANRYNVSSFG